MFTIDPILTWRASGRTRERAASAWRWAGALALGLLTVPAAAQTPLPQNPAQTQTPPVTPPPTGLTELPHGPPPTGLRAPLPPPALPIPRADRPLLVSPGLKDLTERLRTQPLTINDAVAIALATNPSLALAQENLLLAHGRTTETRAAFNPTVGATASFTQLDQGSKVNFNNQSITITNASQGAFGITATLPLDIAGLLRAATSQAQFQEIAARLDINRTRNQIVLDVKTAFYNVLRDEALVIVATQNLQNTLDNLSDAQKRLRAGTVARFDVIRAESDVANAQQQLIQARSNVSLATATLNSIIGINVNTPIQVSREGAGETPPGVPPLQITPETFGVPNAAPNRGPAPPAPGGSPAPGQGAQANPSPAAPQAGNAQPPKVGVAYNPLELGPAYDAVLAEALQTRPEILQGEANIAAAHRGVQLAWRSYLPSLNLSLSGSYQPLIAGFSPRTASGEFVASLSVPIWDGGVGAARVEQAHASVASAETNRRLAVDQVTLEVRQAYLNLLQARDRVAVANAALASAQESFRLARVRYNAGVTSQAGVSPLLELSDAQNALTQAENNVVSALYDFNSGRAQLDKAAGRYSYAANAPGYAAPPTPQQVGAPRK
jgi:outer membrane protein TolC